MNRFIKALGSLLLAGVVAACGGGGGSAGGTGGGGTTGPDPTDPVAVQTAKVADFAVFTDKTTIANNGTDSALLTVVTVDANRNVVAGAAVTVNTDRNSLFVPSGTVTDASGKLTGTVEIGGDKTDRDVTVTVTVNGITKRLVVHIGGSKLTLAATPAAPTPGQTVQVTATLVDIGGNPIAGQSVRLGGTIPAVRNQTVVTNAAGQGTFSFTAPATAGAYTITASGSGTQAADLNLTVFSSGSAVPAANIPAGVVGSLAANPNVLAVNAPGSDANKTVLRFLLLDSANAPVKNVRVRFVDLTTGLPAVGASIVGEGSTLYTDASGSVSTQYVSGQNSSPTNGVKIRACYKATDFVDSDFNSLTGDCPGLAHVDTNLTVAGQALAVSIGDDNVLSSQNGTYIKRFAVTVADSAGRAVANAPVDISVDITHYQKGSFGSPTLTLTSVQALGKFEASSMIAVPSLTSNVWCPNEDANRNGNVDPTTVFEIANPELVTNGFTGRGENYNNSKDTNNQPTLEPRKSDILISYDDPTKTTTDASGVLIIRVQYSQRFGSWLAYRVRVTANVAGSQGLAERLFVTDVLKEDLEDGSFLTPPYGSGRCVDPN